jgi:uncharacterized membrane-anchored protein YhcB (DUF1043 family)
MFRMAAKVAKTENLQTMYAETADVLEGISKAYNDLYEACSRGQSEGDWSKVREHIRRVEAEKEKSKERSGAA